MRYLFLFLVVLGFVSCRNDTLSSRFSACGVDDPVRNLSWLKEKIEANPDQSKQLTVRMFDYKGTTYFDWSLLVMSCMTCAVYDCEGNLLRFGEVYDERELNDFVTASRGAASKVIWRGEATVK
jgi:hypothetical protein